MASNHVKYRKRAHLPFVRLLKQVDHVAVCYKKQLWLESLCVTCYLVGSKAGKQLGSSKGWPDVAAVMGTYRDISRIDDAILKQHSPWMNHHAYAWVR